MGRSKRVADMTPEQRARRKAYEDARNPIRGRARAEAAGRTYTPRGPRGTLATTPPVQLHAGQELKGQSILLTADGKLRERWDKSHIAANPPAFAVVPAGHHVIKTTTLLGPDARPRAQYVTAAHAPAAREALFWAACKANAAEFAGKYAPTPAPIHTQADWLSVYPWSDPHVGMLAWEPETGAHHDLRIAIDDLTTATDLLVERAPASDTALLISLGDFFHAESDLQQTPGHGNKLDVDGRWGKVLRAGLVMQERGVLRMLEKHARVLVMVVPGNHDPNATRMVSIYLEAVFRDEPRVTILPGDAATIGATRPYQVYEFGLNMIMGAHGDGAKLAALPGLAATRWPDVWGRTRFRRAYTGHVHHESAVEFPGMTAHTFGILAPGDQWHKWKGYDSMQMLEVLSHHRTYGMIRRASVGIAEVRAAQRKAAV